MKKAVSMMLFAMLIFSTVLIAAPITKCEDEEDPIHIYYSGNKISDSPGPIVWTGPCTAESFTITVRIKWDSPPAANKNVQWVNVSMTEKTSFGITFVPLSTRLYNPNHGLSPDYCDVVLTVPVAGLPAGTYAVNIYVAVTAQGPGDNPTISGTDGYFQFVKTVCPPPQATISGLKFHDVDADGVRDVGEEGLEGWTIQLWKDGTCVQTTTTGSAGDYIFTVTEAGHYKVTEVLEPGWKQTAPAGGYYEFDVALGGVITGIDFGNIKLGSISGAKFYDANVNGVWDSGEPPIAGWKVHLTGTNILGEPIDDYAFTGADGEFIFKDLLPGTYTVEEVFPSGTWVSTTATLFSHDLEEGENYVGPNFGNVCLMPGTGGKTLGFWSNKNGQALITSSDVTALNALNLYKPTGWMYPPFSNDLATAKTQIKNYLLSATAVNMSWMLSAQLIATKLNVLHGFLSGSTIVYVGPSTYVPTGFISIDEIMANANTALA